MPDQRTKSIELYALKLYMHFHPEIGLDFEKRVRPDFYIQNSNIGIEVTEFTSPRDVISDKIIVNVVDMKPEEVERRMRKKYKEHADYFSVHSIGNSIGITYVPPRIDRSRFVEQICKKYEKYKADLDQYKKFIVLCVATGIEITEAWEAEEVLKNAFDMIHDKRLHVAILFRNGFGKWVLQER